MKHLKKFNESIENEEINENEINEFLNNGVRINVFLTDLLYDTNLILPPLLKKYLP
jgi:hypothetical protein